ncbi:hypothetical protein J2S40_000554 [Nocardioides luteus]|uniref:Uncharacterized protein n=1 Tax=Nocardioides luteus TaxID=1844 RepID=A0ABQ5SVL4_9ACTN|nr:hypothetical protein [Nocardioides luteus]MDR7309496.1 hypothetical protein [Nocardioides luteus]GGR51622.1 hypothetical protein GCM10010197_17170 [Nocardioides luteus]GLJ67901.1 hypothetical protein GCM10017579_19370 [Nocardioides luteus]
MRLLAGLLLGLVVGVVGLVVGVAAVAVHPWWWGLLLALAASSATLAALPRGVSRIAYAAAWAIVIALAATPRPAGGYAIAGDLEGYLMIFWAVLMIVVATATVSRRRPQADAAAGGE